MRLLPITAAMCLSLIVMSASTAQEKKLATPKSKALTLQFYPLGELANPIQGFPYSPAPSEIQQSHRVPPGGGQGGGGFGGGSGFFSVPTVFTSEPLQSEQIGSPIEVRGQPSPVQLSNETHATLIELISRHIDWNSWEASGGDASITAVNDTLLVWQTAENHRAIQQFLREMQLNTVGGQPLRMEIWWLPLDAAARRKLQNSVAADASPSELDELCESAGGYHGSLQGRNRVTANPKSEHTMPLIVSRIPVVGNGTSGEQPIISQVHIGIRAEVTPHMLESWQGEGVRLAFSTAITTMSEMSEAENNGGAIDRFQLGSHNLETNTLCRFDKPAVVGELSAVGLFPDDEEEREMVVVVLVSR